MDLTEVAAGNRDARLGEAASVLAGDSTGTLARFRTFADDTLMSVSLTSDKVLCFDRFDEILDTRRFYAAVMGDAAAGQAAFLASWGSIHRRLAFENLWEHGTRIVYGSLNGGGLGPQDPYGTTCLVIDPESEQALALAVFPGNTALRFTDVSGVADEVAAKENATSWPERAAAAVIERAAEVLARDEGEWADVLCRDDHFLEVDRAGVLPLGMLTETRLAPDVYDRLEELWWAHEMAESLAPDEMVEVDVYSALLRWEREHGAVIVPTDG